MDKVKFIKSTLLAWIIFIGIDFLMHASILENLWAEEITAIKPSIDLTILIPVGYLSFLLLTILFGFIFVRIYPQKPKPDEALKMGLILGVLYALSNLLGVFSYVDIPLRQLVFFNLTYLVEILAVIFCYYRIYYRSSNKKQTFLYILYFLILIIAGIIIQNII